MLLSLSSYDFKQTANQISSSKEIVYLDDHAFYILPPEGFEPLTASDEDLKKYGLPERPRDEEGRLFWESLYVNNPTFIEPIIGESPDWCSADPDLIIGSSHDKEPNRTYSSIWSGCVRNATSYGANGVITIPTVSADASYRPAQCAGWVGIGGISSSLAQLGFNAIVYNSGSVMYYVWNETIGTDYNNNPQPIWSFAISPGDNLFVSTWLDYSAATGVDIHYYYHNMTQNTYTSTVVNITQYNNITSSAEWIMERPTVSGSPTNLAKPTTSSSNVMCFSSCKYKNSQNTSSWTTMTGGSVYRMRNSLFVLLAEGSTCTSGSMNVTWYKYK